MSPIIRASPVLIMTSFATKLATPTVTDVQTPTAFNICNVFGISCKNQTHAVLTRVLLTSVKHKQCTCFYVHSGSGSVAVSITSAQLQLLQRYVAHRTMHKNVHCVCIVSTQSGHALFSRTFIAFLLMNWRRHQNVYSATAAMSLKLTTLCVHDNTCRYFPTCRPTYRYKCSYYQYRLQVNWLRRETYRTERRGETCH